MSSSRPGSAGGAGRAHALDRDTAGLTASLPRSPPDFHPTYTSIRASRSSRLLRSPRIASCPCVPTACSGALTITSATILLTLLSTRSFHWRPCCASGEPKSSKLRYRRVITMAGIGVQDPGIRLHDPGIGVHDGSESVFRMVRNTQRMKTAEPNRRSAPTVPGSAMP